MRRLLSLQSWLCLAAISASQFIVPPADLITVTGHAGVPIRYKQVPTGICELNPNVKSFSGYADVGKDQHIFFWFFEAREVNPRDAPLTVWVDGGPGSSSMIGLFEQLGPCRVDYFGKVYENPYSWSRRSNMLFIDQPSQVGFSYSIPVPGTMDPDSGRISVLQDSICPSGSEKTCGTWSLPSVNLTANSTRNAAPNVWKTLQGFMGAFPQYSRDGLHLATDSYGGHYGPIFSDYFMKQNEENISDAMKISLHSLLIGNGWMDPVIQFQAYYNFTVSPGNTYDLSFYNTSTQQKLYDNLYGKGNCVDRLQTCENHGDDSQCAAADKFCISNVQSFLGKHANRGEHDIRMLMPDPYPYLFYMEYLNRADVQAAIGAFTNFSISSAVVDDAFSLTGDDGREVGAIQALRGLVHRGISVALYAGDTDYDCNWLGVQKIADIINVPGWQEAGFADLVTSDGRLHAQVKQMRKFSFTRFFEAGHQVPFYQPLASLEFFERVISVKDIATGRMNINEDDNYRTQGPSQSTYREGNSTVQHDVTPLELAYDVFTNVPGAPWGQRGDHTENLRKRMSRYTKKYLL